MMGYFCTCCYTYLSTRNANILLQINESGKLPAPGEPWDGESPLLTTLPQPLYAATPQTAGVSACCTWITPNYKQPTTNQLLQGHRYKKSWICFR